MKSAAFRTGAVAAVALTMLGAGSAEAQTPPEVCAADSLYLISPASVDLRLETTGKQGLTISWPNLNLDQATCYSLSGNDTLDFDVSVDGGFGDRVDRVFKFTTADSGLVGAPNATSITIQWQNEGPATNGTIGGQINISNNGGIWRNDPLGGWAQVNNGLPMTWLRTNTVALDRGTGEFMVAAFTRGTTLDGNPSGVYVYNGTNWSQVGSDVLGTRRVVTKIAVAPGDNDSFAVGTATGGLFVTTDGGQTFTQWTSELDPAATPVTTYRVSALNWESSRLLVAMPNWGVFLSDDGGASFTRSVLEVPDNLDVPEVNRTYGMGVVNDFSVDPADPDRIAAALAFHGVYLTTNGGQDWTDLYGDLLVSDPENPGAWVYSAREVLVDDVNPQVLVMAVSQKGLFRTTDSGATWSLVATEPGLQPTNLASLGNFSMIRRPGAPGEMLVMEDKWGLLQSTDSGASWQLYAEQPLLAASVALAPSRAADRTFTQASYGGGIYEGGTVLELKDTYSTATSTELRGLDLGLRISFAGGGEVNRNDTFRLVAQTFQGWAVWRSSSHDRRNMTLVGLFDRVNPEDCYEGYCGDNSLEIIPQCFAAKRAACFDLSDPDTLRFFDDEVYNGFSYYYAVTAFDYGNTALSTPQSNTNEMFFSPRWAGDELSPFVGEGNSTRFDVNEPVTPDVWGEEVYAYPNPVRLGAGVPRGEGSLVVFTNLPEGSRVRVFTTAGDDVINLGPDNQTGGQIYWNTVNRDGAEISAGVYLYKVEMPARDDHWGRIVVIR
ncbi:hypothetical protein KDM41_01735 [bacterium]|nr:hypothetical protein [bacterium]